MSGILLQPEEARGYAGDVKTAAADTQSDMQSLRQRIEPLKDVFRGASADAFDNRYTEWHTSAEQLLEALDGLGTFLEGAANSLEETDRNIASQLGG
jgi:WXG100 family type VII secretion target